MIAIPRTPNDKTRMKAALQVAGELKRDARVDGNISDIAADLVKHCRFGDGYEMARALEQYANWDCNMQIAEILDGYSSQVDQAHRAFLEEFRQEHNIDPPLPVLAKVKTKHGIGMIDGVYEYRPLSYTVAIDGDPECSEPENKRFILYFDEVEAA